MFVKTDSVNWDKLLSRQSDMLLSTRVEVLSYFSSTFGPQGLPALPFPPIRKQAASGLLKRAITGLS